VLLLRARQTIGKLAAAALCVAGRFIVALIAGMYPRSLILLLLAWPWRSSEIGWGLFFFVLTPVFYCCFSGPLSVDEDRTPEIWSELLIAAAVVTVVWTIVVLYRRRFSRANRTPG
jgi:hypothetical protein